ncbi:hypothetical protein BDR06DRAFT_203107 [Suillus hirtellus]|nr:hypothetical protein BDR06DRAFT_203107 [Suillus hirtellus]
MISGVATRGCCSCSSVLTSPSWCSGNVRVCNSSADACILIPRVVRLLQHLCGASCITHHGSPHWIGEILVVLLVVAIGSGLDVSWVWRMSHLGTRGYN